MIPRGRRRSALRIPMGIFATLGIIAISTGIACFDFSNYSLQGFAGEGANGGNGQDADVEDAFSPCTPPVAEGLCGTFPQCGCMPVFTCDVTDFNGHTQCVVDQGLALGDKCGDLFSGCGLGLTCVDQTCKRFCKGRSCDNGGGCTQVSFKGDGGFYSIPGMRVCTDQCDYMNPDALCPSGVTCAPVLPLGVQPGYSSCKPSGGSTTTCNEIVDCAPGMGCGEDLKCHAWCNANTPFDCPPPQKCKSFKVNDVYGYYYVDVDPFGLCML